MMEVMSKPKTKNKKNKKTKEGEEGFDERSKLVDNNSTYDASITNLRKCQMC
jgi:hypothetical protein